MAALMGICLFCVVLLSLCLPSAAFVFSQQLLEESAADEGGGRPRSRRSGQHHTEAVPKQPTEEEKRHMLLEKRKAEDADSRKRKLEGAQRRLESEQNRSLKMKDVLAHRQEEQQRLSEVKAGRRIKQVSSLQKQEHRLVEKMKALEKEDARKLTQVHDELVQADLQANGASEARAKAESIGEHFKERLRNRTAEHEAEVARLASKRDLARQQLALERQAIDQRKACQQPEYFPLPREDPLDSLMNGTDVSALVKGFILVAHTTKFMSQLKVTTKAVSDLAAEYRYNAVKSIGNLTSTVGSARGGDFAPQLANFFRLSADELGAQQAQAGRTFNRLLYGVPGPMRRNIQSLVAVWTGTPVANGSLDVAEIDVADSLQESCAQLTATMARITSVGANITQAHRVLNATAKALPKLDVDEKIGRVPEEAKSVMQSLLHLGYLETIAVGDVMKQIIAQVGPIISGKCARLSKKHKLG